MQKSSKFFLITGSFLVLGIATVIATNSGQLFQGKLNLSGTINQPTVTKPVNDINIPNNLRLTTPLTAVLAFKNYHYLDATKLTEKNIDQGITREQGVHLIFQVLNPLVGKAVTTSFNQSYRNCYNDTNGSYAETSICWAKNNNLWVKGTSFTPQIGIRRDEAVMLIGKILEEKFYTDLPAASKLAIPYPDLQYPTTDTYLKNSIQLLIYKNLLSFDQTKPFDPQKNITLGELSEILLKVKLTYNTKAINFTQTLLDSFNKTSNLCRTGNLFPAKTEKIEQKVTYVIADYSAKAHPNWKQEADTFMTAVNKLYEPVGISFKITNYLTMPNGINKDFYSNYITQHPEYFYENNKTGVTKGLTIFACLSDLNTFNAQCPFAIGSGGYRTRAGNTIIGGKKFSYVGFGQSDQKFLNLDKAYIDIMAHEIGHSFDLSLSPIEWYSLRGIDGKYPADVKTYYTDYQLCKDNQEYGKDPMCNYYQGPFSSYSKAALLINKYYDLSSYLTHPELLTTNYTNSFYPPMADFRAEKVRVKITNNAGVGIPNASFQLALPELSNALSAQEYATEVKTIITDNEGVAYLDAPFLSQNFHSYLIKTLPGIGAAGPTKKFITYLDVQKAAMVDNQCVYDVNISQ